MQSDIIIDDEDGLSGTLNYVTGYTGYSEDVSGQTGHFLAIRAVCEGAEISVSTDSGDAQNAGNGIFVVQVADGDEELVITANGGAAGSIIKSLALDGLTLAQQT